MDIRIEIERNLRVDLPYGRVVCLLDDLEGTIGRFPKLRRLSQLNQYEYLWEMQPIGSRVANIAHQVSYAARYQVEPGIGMVRWTPLRGHGNASVEGWFRIADHGVDTELTFRVCGTLREVPVPFMYRLLAPPFIQGKFTHLVDEFLTRTRGALAA
jgi:hypothetical protein